MIIPSIPTPEKKHQRKSWEALLMQSLDESLARRLRLALPLELLLAELFLLVCSSVWVETELYLEIPERVLLLHHTTLGDSAATNGAKDLLDIARVDDLAEVGLAH